MNVRVHEQAEHPSQGAGRGNSTTNVRWLLAIIIALSLGIDLFFFNGYYASDDNQYWRGALAILNGQFGPSGPSLGEMRLALTGWNALIIALVGPRIQLVAASYVVFHQLLNLAMFALGARLFSARVGLLAAYLSALTPLLVSFSTLILPDIPMAFWILLSFLAFHEAYRLRGRRRGARAGLLLLLAGMCAGLAYATKESGLIVLPFYFVLWLVLERRAALDRGQRVRWRSASGYGTLFAAGVAVVFIAETAVLSALNNGLLVRMGWTTADIAATRVARIERVSGLSPVSRAQRAYDVVTDDRLLPPMLRGFLLFGLVAYPFVRRRPWSLWVLAAWLFIYLTWGSMSLSRYIPPNIKVRYYIIIIPILTLLASASLLSLWSAIVTKVPHRPSQSALRWLGISAAVFIPLLWLGGPNQLAGRIYRSKTVGPARRAVSQALVDSERLVVMSGSVAHLLEPMLIEDLDDVAMPADHVTADVLRHLAKQGGFEYVELDERLISARRDRIVRPATLDRVIHPLIHERVVPLTDEVSWRGVILGWTARDNSYPHFRLGDYLFSIRARATFRDVGGRLSEIWTLVGGEIAPRTHLESGRSATIYRVDAKLVAPGAPRETRRDDEVGLDLTPALEHWRIWRTNDYRLARSSGLPPTIHMALADDARAWYVPGPEDPERTCELDGPPYWEVTTCVMLEGSVRLELWLSFYQDPACEQSLARKRLLVQPGLNRFGVWVPEEPVFVRPAFRVTGRGQFRVDSLSFTRCSAGS